MALPPASRWDEVDEMARVITLSVDHQPQQVECTCGDLDLILHERVVAQTEHGLVTGRVVAIPQAAAEAERPRARVVRRLTADDKATIAELKILDAKAFLYARRRITERNMEMRLLTVHHRFDAMQATFYFIAERRIDFRDLVRELAYQLRIRVEMRQVSQREAPQLLDGVGPCGRQLCCSGYIHEFQTVSVRMAKIQGISLSPPKLSGCCGKLKCCLRYEQDGYEAFHKGLPRHGAEVTVDGMKSKVLSHQYIRRITLVARGDGERVTVQSDALRAGAVEPVHSDQPLVASPAPLGSEAFPPRPQERSHRPPRSARPAHPERSPHPPRSAQQAPPQPAPAVPTTAAAGEVPAKHKRRRRRGRGHGRGGQGDSHGGQGEGPAQP